MPGAATAPPYRARVTLIGTFGQWLRTWDRAASSPVSMLRPQRVLSATQSVAYWQR